MISYASDLLDGDLDEDEFNLAIEYLDLRISGQRVEQLFKKYDIDKSGTIEYPEFRAIWLRYCNVRKQLKLRKYPIGRFDTNGYLRKVLDRLLRHEEEMEAQAIAEATSWYESVHEMRRRRFSITCCKETAFDSLATCLDMAGTVYIFGTGSNKQFGDASVPCMPQHSYFAPIEKMEEIDSTLEIIPIFPETIKDPDEITKMEEIYKFNDEAMSRIPFVFDQRIHSTHTKRSKLTSNLKAEANKIYDERLRFSDSSASDSSSDSSDADMEDNDNLFFKQEAPTEHTLKIKQKPFTPPLLGRPLKMEKYESKIEPPHYYPDLDRRSREEIDLVKNKYPNNAWMANLSGKRRRRLIRQKKGQSVWFRSQFKQTKFLEKKSPSKSQLMEMIEDVLEAIENIDYELEELTAKKKDTILNKIEDENNGDISNEKDDPKYIAKKEAKKLKKIDDLRSERITLRKELRVLKSRLRKVKQAEEDALRSTVKHEEEKFPFKDYNLRSCSAGLWGRQIMSVSFTNNVAIAYNASGDVFTFGGKKIWYRSELATEMDEKTGGGDITRRSKTIKTVSSNNKVVADKNARQEYFKDNPLPTAGDENVDRKKVADELRARQQKWKMAELKLQQMKRKLAEQRKTENLQSPTKSKDSEEELLIFEQAINTTDEDIRLDQEADKIKKTLEYFEKMRRPPSQATRLKYFDNVLIPSLDFTKLRIAFISRSLGNELQGKSARELVILFAEILITAENELGLIASDELNVFMKKMELKIFKLRRRIGLTILRHKRIRRFFERAQLKWNCIYEIYMDQKLKLETEQRRIEKHKAERAFLEYTMARYKRAHGEDGFPVFTSDQKGDTLTIGGITARGPAAKTPRGKQAIQMVSCGAEHVCLINSDGRMYTWGVGSHGRLGHALDAPIYEAVTTTVAQQLKLQNPLDAAYNRYDPNMEAPKQSHDPLFINTGVVTKAKLTDSPLNTMRSPDRRNTLAPLVHDQARLPSVRSTSSFNSSECTTLPNFIPSPPARSPVRRVPRLLIVNEEDGYKSPSETARRLQRAKTPWNKHDISPFPLNTKSRKVYEKQLEFDHKDIAEPKAVVSLKNMIMSSVSAGAAHTAAVNNVGELWVCGSGVSGQLGIGDMDDQRYVPFPIQVSLPYEIKAVACGSNHTAVVTISGKLLVAGNGDGGRLGLGTKALKKSYKKFKVVEHLRRYDIAQVSCGICHTVVATKVIGFKSFDMSYPDRQLKVQGGQVFIAGAAYAFCGIMHPKFTEVTKLRKTPVVCVSAGASHTAAVTAEGELYTWGNNLRGGCAQPKVISNIPFPKRVDCLYRSPSNLAVGCPTSQLDPWADRGDSGNAVNGHRSGLGNRDETSLTQPRRQAWFDLDLQENCYVEEITIWNRNDVPKDRYKSRDYFMRRLFPCWVMISESPFPKYEGSLDEAIASATEAKRFTETARFFTWHLPVSTVGRYVRVQIEKLNSLHLAEVEVYGRIHPCTPPVFSVECGRDATAVVCRPRSSETLEKAYLRACHADRYNAIVLRQIPAFQDYFDTFQAGLAIGEDGQRCRLCTSARSCDRCDVLKRYIIVRNCENSFREKHNRLPTLHDISSMLLKENLVRRPAQPPMQRRLRSCLSCIDDVEKCISRSAKNLVEGKMSEIDSKLEHYIRGV